MRRVIVADDDKNFVQLLCQKLNEDGMFEVVAGMYDGSEALEQIKIIQPDIVILDIVMPGSDGIYIVDYIRNKMKNYSPIIYILSGIGTQRIITLLNTLNIDFFSLKPVSLEIVIKNLKSVDSQRYDVMDPGQNQIFTPRGVKSAVESGDKRRRIEQLTMQLGMLPHRKSTKCINDALVCCAEDPENTQLITKILYPDVAKKNGMKPSAVERNIRQAIEFAQKAKTPTYDLIFAYFPNKKITNSEFLAVITDYLSMKLPGSEDF